ncbi:MAG: serine/threonine-protein kinase [Planctomycetota bacterium]
MASANPAQDEPGQAAAAAGGSQDRGDGDRRGAMKFVYSTGDRPLEGYTIRRGIGRGGFGEVYFAESDAGKEVAMKLIRRNLEVELRGVRHCLNLKHPNLVALYDIRTDDAGDDWVIMEYVTSPGAGAGSLEDVLAQKPEGLPEAEVQRWVRGIAAGVGHLHANGIVHRDLKPGNIFLDGDTVKVGDYGLSKFISCSRRSGQTESVGTVHYMAPEIANGRYGREIDTYALGVMLYEMLTGAVPFEGESVGEVLMKHLTAEPDLSRVSEPYREIVRRALAKDPESRLRNVGELLALLPGGEAEAVLLPDDEPPVATLASAAAPSPDYRPPISTKSKPEEEPIYRSLVDGWSHFWDSWRESSLNPVAKGVLLVIGGIAALITSELWIPASIAMAVLYAVYYVIWSTFIRPGIKSKQRRQDQMTTAAAPRRGNRHAVAAEKRRRRLTWRQKAREELLAKSWRVRTTELIGSMLTAAALSLVASLFAAALAWNTTSDPEAFAVWLAITSTLGSWGVLVTNKLTEGRVEDQTPMRGMLLLAGALVGLVSGGLSAGLGVGLPWNRDIGPRANESMASEVLGLNLDVTTSAGNGVIVGATVAAAYFALLFLLIRWWKQSEYTRNKRLSVLSVVGCVFGAWLLHLFWWFPQPAGMIVAAVVSLTTQLSSPWLPPSRREELARGSVV